MSAEVLLGRLVRRMDVLIALQLEEAADGKDSSVTEKIDRLRRLGVSPAEIASILGKSTNYVTGAISQRKKRSRKAR